MNETKAPSRSGTGTTTVWLVRGCLRRLREDLDTITKLVHRLETEALESMGNLYDCVQNAPKGQEDCGLEEHQTNDDRAGGCGEEPSEVRHLAGTDGPDSAELQRAAACKLRLEVEAARRKARPKRRKTRRARQRRR